MKSKPVKKKLESSVSDFSTHFPVLDSEGAERVRLHCRIMALHSKTKRMHRSVPYLSTPHKVFCGDFSEARWTFSGDGSVVFQDSNKSG